MSKKSFNLKKIKKEYIIVAVLVLVAVYFIFNSFKDINSSNNKSSSEKGVVEQYVDNLENKLQNSVSRLKGVGKTTVSISVKGSYESVLATEKTTTQTQSGQVITESPIIVGGKTVLLQEEYPQITGVVIVACGADNITTKTNIMNLAVTFLGVDSQKIIILNGKK